MRLFKCGLLAAVGFVVAGCASQPSAPLAINDGELKPPAGYQGWTKFLSAVQRPDAKQVREIYMNDSARKGTRDKGFPDGSVFVMENYAAQANPDGTLKTGADGKLVKGELLSVFVQGKNPGWGAAAIPELKNGSWVYAAYTPTGDKAAIDLNTCRACHLPLKDKDFVHRYDEYFNSKTSSLGQTVPLAAVTQVRGMTTADLALAHAALR